VYLLYAAWTLKHKPRSLTEVVGNSEAIAALRDWIKSWEKGTPKKRVCFLYGPPGIGKTVTVEATANDLQMELVEKNASDYRTEDAINRFAGLASQYGSILGGKRLVLLDELDGLTGNADRGGVKAITEIAKNAQAPVVLIANDVYDQRFSILRSQCLLIEFKKPAVSDVMKQLNKICQRENIQADENALKFIAHRSGGDVRSAVNDLQALAQGKKQLKYEDVSWLGYRDRQDSIFNVLRMILYARTAQSSKQAVDIAEIDNDMLFEWIYENVPLHFTDPHDLAQAMDALSRADVFRGRIRSTQNWGYLRYVIDYMTAGVAMARQNSKPVWVPFKFPGRIQSLSRTKMERALQLSICKKIKTKCHISAKRSIREFLPYIRIIFKNDLQEAAGIAKWLDLNEEMIENLAGTRENAEKIMAGINEIPAAG
jgi:replication factor C large subunit